MLGLTTLNILLCFTVVLWFLLLLFIISRINGMQKRINHLITLLGDFEKLEKDPLAK